MRGALAPRIVHTYGNPKVNALIHGPEALQRFGLRSI